MDDGSASTPNLSAGAGRKEKQRQRDMERRKKREEMSDPATKRWIEEKLQGEGKTKVAEELTEGEGKTKVAEELEEGQGPSEEELRVRKVTGEKLKEELKKLSQQLITRLKEAKLDMEGTHFDGGSLVSPSTKEPIELVVPGSVEGHEGEGGLKKEMEMEEATKTKIEGLSSEILEDVEEGWESHAENDENEGAEFYEEEEERNYGYLCTIFCDFLCGLASAPDRVRFDPISIRCKAMAGFRKCYKNGEWTSCQLGIETVGIDIRGFYIPIALKVLMMHLYCWSGHSHLKRLLVTVGCMEHGCGEGKLKHAVIETLMRDKTIKFELLDTDGATISIPLDRTDYTSVGWPLIGREPWEENMEVEGETEENIDDNFGYLCTTVCDFLAGLDTTKPGLLWDREISSKVLSGFRKCEKDVPCELDDDTVGIDIRGHYFTDALEIMMTHLFCWSRQSHYKKLLVKVGCKMHGFGEGILKKKVTEVLELDKKISFRYLDKDTTICILLDGRSDYKDTNWYLANIEEEAQLADKEMGSGI